MGGGNSLMKQLLRSAGDSIRENDNTSRMDGSYQKDGAACRFTVINLVMVDGGDGLLLPLHRVSDNSYPENPDFPLLEDPY